MHAYSLTEDQQLLKAAARSFAEKTLSPAAARIEPQGVEFPSEILRQMGQLGFLGLDIAPEFGGQGLDTLSCAAILEELAGGWFSSTIYAMNLATGPIIAAASAAQKERYLPAICRGAL